LKLNYLYHLLINLSQIQMPVQTRAAQIISERNRRNASYTHHDTPKKIRVRAAVDMVKKANNYASNLTKQAIFVAAGVSSAAGHRILTQNLNSNRTFPHKDLPDWKETRRAPNLVTPAHIQRMEAIIEAADVEERSITWEALGAEAKVYNPEFLKDGSRSKKAGKLMSWRTI
jgi:hypothetical protein